MSFSSGTFSINSAGQPVVTGTTISSTAFNALTADLATGLSTCVLKDGTQTMTANLPMAGYVLTGLGAGSTSGQSVRYEQVLLLSLIDAAGDLIYGTAADTAARLAIGTARQQLATNAGATAPEWVASLQSLMTAQGDIVQASSANTPARLAIGTKRQVPMVNTGATALAYANPITLATMQATTSGTEFDFTGIPANVRRITIAFDSVSLSDADDLLVQIGDAGGIETTDYQACSGITNYTTGFGIERTGDLNSSANGTVTLCLMDSATFLWVCSIALQTSASISLVGGGRKALSAELTQLRLTRIGTGTFDQGAVNITYE